MYISIYSVSQLITSVIVGGTAIVVLLGGKNRRSSASFAFTIFLVTAWIIASAFAGIVKSVEQVDLFTRITYFLGGAIPCSFFYFFNVFPEENRPPLRLTLSLISLQFTFFILYFFTDLIVFSNTSNNQGYIESWNFGPLSILFEIFFFGFFIFGSWLLYGKYKNAKQTSLRFHLKYMLAVIIVGSIPPSILSVILPRLGYFDLNWLGPVTQIFWIPIIAYSIVKHRLFNTKIIAIEIVTFTLWVIILIRTFMAKNVHEVMIEASLLAVTVIFGILLIRSIFREQEQRETIEKLSKDLRLAYSRIKEQNESLEDIQKRLL